MKHLKKFNEEFLPGKFYNEKDVLNILNYFSMESIDDHNEQYVQEWFDNSYLKKDNYSKKDVLNILNYFSMEFIDSHNEQYVQEWFYNFELREKKL